MTVDHRDGTIGGMTTSFPRWVAPAGLILLSAVPVAAGAFRISQLSTGADIADPVPLTVHIVTATVFCLAGALQFMAPKGSRGPRRPGWHRVTGRILVPAGLGAALSGLWLTVFHPHPDDVGALVTAFRLVFGVAMAVAIGLGLAAVRRRDFARHRAWMIRGYAIGLGAGTQAFTHAAVIAATGPVTQTSKAYAMLAGWLLNVAVAEYAIRRPTFTYRRYVTGAAR
jgi:uncharacterized membrane protein